MAQKNGKQRIIAIAMVCLILLSAFLVQVLWPREIINNPPDTDDVPQPVIMATASTIATDFDAQYVFWRSWQQKIFFAKNLWWAFYANGTVEYYYTSRDGKTWDGPTVVSTEVLGKFNVKSNEASIWYDENTSRVFNVYATGLNDLWFKQGTLNSNGTIQWGLSTNIQSDSYCRYPTICVDSYGYPWIACSINGYPYVFKSSTNDGTWVTDIGFPYKLSNSSVGAYGGALVLPLSNGKVWTFTVTSDGSYSPGQTQVWNGAFWLSISNTSNVIGGEANGEWSWGAVSDGDNVHLIYLQNNTNYIAYENYSYSTNSYSSEKIIWAKWSQPFVSPMIALDKTTSRLYAVWWDSNTQNEYTKYGHNPWAYYSEFKDNKWSEVSLFVNESLSLGSTPVVSGYSGSLASYVSNGYLAMVYVNGTSYDAGIAMPVRFAQLPVC